MFSAPGFADEESQIEQRYTSAREEQQEAFTQALARMERRRADQEADTRQKYDQRLAQVEQKFQSEMAGLNEMTQEARRRIEHEKDVVEQDLRRQVEQAVWLSESVLEGAGVKLREELKKAQRDYDQHIESLDELENQTGRMLWNLGLTSTAASQSLGAAGAGAASPGSEGLSFDLSHEAAKGHLLALGVLWVPKLVVSFRPYLAGAGLCLLAAVVVKLIAGWLAVGLSIGLVAGGVIVAGMVLASISREQIRECFGPLRQALDDARAAATKELTDAKAALRRNTRRPRPSAETKSKRSRTGATRCWRRPSAPRPADADVASRLRQPVRGDFRRPRSPPRAGRRAIEGVSRGTPPAVRGRPAIHS